MINLNESEKHSQTKIELLKLETEALEKKKRFDADAEENNFRLERFKVEAIEINRRWELEILKARRALLSEGHEDSNEFKVYQDIRMLSKWIESDMETFFTSVEKLATTHMIGRERNILQ